MTASALVPPELLDPVVARFNPRRIILFGSHARGDAGPDSDIDLLVVVDDDTPPALLTLRAAAGARSGYCKPADVIPIREETFRRTSGIPGTLSRVALLEGVTVYEKIPAAMSEPSPADRRASVVGWLKVARSDLQVARLCLSAAPPELTAAAYHCQQAAEKLLKGFLVVAGVDFRKTDDLDALGALVGPKFQALGPLIVPVRGWTSWGIAYRYPDLTAAETPPSSEELAASLHHLSRLADALEAEVPPPATDL